MNHNTTETFQKFPKRKSSDHYDKGRKGRSVNERKKHSYSTQRDMKRKCED